MKKLSSVVSLLGLLLVLALSLLLVLLNPEVVDVDIFGLFFIHHSLGLLLLFTFVSGIFLTLALSFIPAWILNNKNKRLQKRFG